MVRKASYRWNVHVLEEMLGEEENLRIEFRTPHAGFQEFGTGPAALHAQYTPPIEPLIEWVEQKLGKSGDEARKIAFAVQQKIHEFGTAPKPFARPAIDAVEPMAAELYIAGHGLAIANMIKDLAREYIMEKGSVASGTLEREIYVVQED